MTTAELQEYVGAFVFATLDEGPAMTRLGFQSYPPVFFLEWLPEPFADDAYYLRIIDLTPRHIEGLKAQGPALIDSTLPFAIEDQLDAKPWLSLGDSRLALEV